MSNLKYAHMIEQIIISLWNLSLFVFLLHMVLGDIPTQGQEPLPLRIQAKGWSCPYYRASGPQPHSDHVLCCFGDCYQSAFHLPGSQLDSLLMSIAFINYSLFITLF